MKRVEIINTVGLEYLKTNVENQEFSYPQAFKEAKIPHTPIKSPDGKREYQYLDLRFEKNKVSVLIETKDDFELSKNKDAEAQLSAYVEYEKALTGNKIIAILANTKNDKIKVWRGAVSSTDFMETEEKIRTIDEYVDFYTSKINNKSEVINNTYQLNRLLHKHHIPEEKRSQFVGTCLLALKYGMKYDSPTLSTKQIIAGIRDVLESLLTQDIKKAEKITLLETNILSHQSIREIDVKYLREILEFIDSKILPYINDKSTAGQDLLNLFFITFNKYASTDKNQVFTPDHITDFMAKVCGVNKNSIVLDPCCGSGSFLVRAMTQALDDCGTALEQDNVKKHQIFGIEIDETIFGLATTNMLIHGDGNSNISRGNCFEREDIILDAKPTIILMNPPYNATNDLLPAEFTKTWNTTAIFDPSKGFYYVKYILDTLNKAHLKTTVAVLLPVACAILNKKNKIMSSIKNDILKENTLKAVFSLPHELFYPTSASACCMVFETGIKNAASGDTFFGYYIDDGFKKRKNMGRIEIVDENQNGVWTSIEEKWLDLYRNKKVVTGLSALHKVTGDDEWLCEAYMETNYNKLKISNFSQSVNDYYAYTIHSYNDKHIDKRLMDIEEWGDFTIGDIFTIKRGDRIVHDVDYFDTKDEINIYPVITATTFNNGVDGYYSKTNCDGNCIISCGEASGMYTTYQENPCWALDTVRIYSFKDEYKSVKMSKEIGLFLSTILTFNMHRFSYGRKAKPDNMYPLNIKLPITDDKKPDWKYMEAYIKSLPYGDRI